VLTSLGWAAACHCMEHDWVGMSKMAHPDSRQFIWLLASTCMAWGPQEATKSVPNVSIPRRRQWKTQSPDRVGLDLHGAFLLRSVG
jgi:hypothetical protein